MNLFFAKPDLGDPDGSHQNCALARSFWGYAGWVGDRVAIEPAGGVSPLRGGAGVCNPGLSTGNAE